MKPRALSDKRARTHERWLAASLLLCSFALACAHGASASSAANGAIEPKPVPDEAAIKDARDADTCRVGEASSSCPPESFEPTPYVSARAYSHLLAALLDTQSENYSGAADELREALLYDPDSAHLHTLLAEALVHLGRIGDADDELRLALTSDPEHGPAHLLAARIASARGHIAEARTHLRAAIAAQPDSPDAYRELVHLEATQSDPEAAAVAARQLEDEVHAVTERSQAAEKQEAAAEQLEAGGAAQAANGAPIDPDGSLRAAAGRLREESGRAWEEVARTLADKRDDANAELAFARAEAIDPAGLDQLASHALFLETRRRFAEARDEELKLLARRPEAPEVLASLARLALEAGDPESAEAHLRKVIDLAADLDPAPIEAGSNSIAVEPPERNEERRELAEALLRAALPLLGARRPAAAAPAFDAALRLLPEQPELLFYRALGLLGRGHAKEAAALLDRVAAKLTQQIALTPVNQNGQATPDRSQSLLGIEPGALLLDARVQSALAKGRAGEMAGSLKELRALFAQNPLDEGCAMGLLEGFDRAGRAAEVIPLVTAALDQHPDDTTLLFALGSAQDRAGQGELAVATMRKLLARAPDHAGALNYVGYSLVEKAGSSSAKPSVAAVADKPPSRQADKPTELSPLQSPLVEARRLLERAVELRPDDGAIADSYGLCLLRLGHPREALVELQRADALTPGDPVVLGHLGDALLATGARAAAEDAFRRALERLEPTPQKSAHRNRSAARTPESEEPLEERPPEANDSRVKSELLEKLRALTAT